MKKIVILCVVALLLIGCAKRQLSNYTKTDIEDVIKNPEHYKGQRILIEGDLAWIGEKMYEVPTNITTSNKDTLNLYPPISGVAEVIVTDTTNGASKITFSYTAMVPQKMLAYKLFPFNSPRISYDNDPSIMLIGPYSQQKYALTPYRTKLPYRIGGKILNDTKNRWYILIDYTQQFQENFRFFGPTF